jgi:hypothetical protein
MQEVNSLERKITFFGFLIGFVLVVTTFVFNRFLSLGLALGTVLSIMNFKLLKRHLVKKITSGQVARPGAGIVFYLTRYVIIGLALWLAIERDLFMFWGLALGLFMVRLAIYLEIFLSKNGKRNRTDTN